MSSNYNINTGNLNNLQAFNLAPELSTPDLTLYNNMLNSGVLGGSVGNQQNLPVQNTTGQTPTQGTMWDTMTPQQIEEAMQAATPAPQSDMNTPSGSIRENAFKNLQRIGTGLTSIYNNWDNPELWNAVEEYFKTHRGVDIFKDFANANFATYNFQLGDGRKRDPIDIALGALAGASENPIDAALDLISFGALKPVAKLADKVNEIAGGRRILQTETSNAIEKGLAANAQEVKSSMSNLYNSLKKVDNKKMAELLKAAEEGTPLPKGFEKDFEALRNFSKQYDELAAKYAPETHVDPKTLATFQRYARLNNTTYQNAKRTLTPLIEEANAGKINLDELSDAGNLNARFIKESQDLYNQGKIFPVTHGLAEVNKLGDTINDADRIFSGRYSTREWGNSTYEDIAKALQTPDAFITGQARRYVNNVIARNMLDGNIGGVPLLKEGQTKNIAYISAEDLRNGDIRKALRGASNARNATDDIVVDKNIIGELKHQLDTEGSALNGVLRQLTSMIKSGALIQGTYLGANAITGATNAVMYSNIHLLNDIINAIGSKGRLSQKLGTYRYAMDDAGSVNIPIAKQLDTAGRVLGGNLLRRADTAIQNIFSEIAAHANMRKMGITPSRRFDAVDQMDKARLGELIVDTKRTALINSTNTVLPKTLNDIASLMNPFWRWQDTAAQSTAHALEKSPVLANTVLVDILSNIGFDQEMQNRMNLGVSLDKPYVTFKFDPKTGQTMTTTAEFVPMMTTIKLLAPDKDSPFGSPTVFGLGTLINAVGGKDKYGNLNKRAAKNGQVFANVQGKRYMYDQNTGEYREIGGMGDEILATAIKELVPPVNLYNRTVAPTIAGVLSAVSGQDIHFNQPYAQSVFGSFDDTDRNVNFLVGGNPSRRRTGAQILENLSGRYSSPYYPQFEEKTVPLTRNNMRSFWRNVNREQLRREIP